MIRGLMLGSLCSLLIPAAYAQPFAGVVELPTEGQTVSGVVLVRGFAISTADISRIELYVDDTYQHDVNINIPRIDIIEAYADWEGIQNKKPGFTTGFLASRFPNGPHTIHVMVYTSDGQVHEVGRRVIEVDNRINQSPFGAVDIPDTSMVHDASGSFPIVGWAADTDGISRIDVLIDGLVTQGAVYGDPRPDVGNAFPDFPAAQFSGFIAHFDSTRVLDGIHQLAVRVTDQLGLSRTIGQRTIQVFNSEANLRPFGSFDEPLRDSELHGTNCGVIPPCQISPCLPVDFDNHITPVRGWALDLGTRENTGRVAYAELMVDGVRWFSTNDCTFSSDLGAYVNCYGLPRFDVARYYPTYPDAPRSGFMFTLDVGALISMGVAPGHHVLKVRVGDQEQTFAELPGTAGVNVFFTCVEDNFNFAPLGFIDFPNKMDFIGGTVAFHGWAVDRNQGVRVVNVYVDGHFMGPAAYGFIRPDVRDAHPTVSGSLHSGWVYTIDTNQLSDGRHRLTVEVIDNQGNEGIIGSVDFFVDNLN
ncbi:MAG TPA: hypothetical protein VMS56_14935 [Thermoanaerobaculia bacterium]|nr:hypothetical protein [Thermoanaerobaculia bacterium]